jgi:hypothetical protein
VTSTSHNSGLRRLIVPAALAGVALPATARAAWAAPTVSPVSLRSPAAARPRCACSTASALARDGGRCGPTRDSHAPVRRMPWIWCAASTSRMTRAKAIRSSPASRHRLSQRHVRLDARREPGLGAGRRASPRLTVRAWMRSPGHGRNILDPRFTDIGIAVVRGAPVRERRRGPAATHATEFGARTYQ